MAIDMFKTRTMIDMLREMKPANVFLRNTFFSNVKTFDTEYVDVDIYKGKRRMAPFVAFHIGGVTVNRMGFTTDTFKPELIAPDMVTTAEDVFKRAAGESVYSAMTPNERMAEQLGRDMAELDTIITRREEWMCAQALFTGQIHMVGEGVDRTISFNMSATHNITLAGTDLWTDAASNPLKLLRSVRRLCIQDSGINPNILVMGTNAIDAFVDHDKVAKALDNRRVERGQIDPLLLPNGVTYWGFIKELGCDVYSYDEWYLDDAGVEQPMVPVDKVLMGSTNARLDMLYGAVADVEDGTIALPRVPKSWTQPKPSARFVALKSRPLPVPVQIDSFAVVKVVA